MKIYDDIIQGSDEWFQKRLGKVTTSKFTDATSARQDIPDLIAEVERLQALLVEKVRIVE